MNDKFNLNRDERVKITIYNCKPEHKRITIFNIKIIQFKMR